MAEATLEEQLAAITAERDSLASQLAAMIEAKDAAIAAGEQRASNITLDLKAANDALAGARARLVQMGPLAEAKASLVAQQAAIDAQIAAALGA